MFNKNPLKKKLGDISKRVIDYITRYNENRRIVYLSQTVISNIITRILEDTKYDLNIYDSQKLVRVYDIDFENKDNYSNFIKRYRKHKSIVYDETKDELFLSDKISKRIFDDIEYYIEQFKYVENPELFERTTRTDIEVNNLFTLRRYCAKMLVKEDDIKKINNIYEDDPNNDPEMTKYHYIVPSENFPMSNLIILYNKQIPNLKFLLNPDIPISYDEEFKYLKFGVVKKFRIKITHQLDTGDSLFKKPLAIKYKVLCPRCNEELTFLPHEIHQNLKHLCPGDYKPAYQNISQKALWCDDNINFYVYEGLILDEKKTNSDKVIHIYSTEIIRPAIYIADIYFASTIMNKDDGNSKFCVLMGYKKDKKQTNKKYFQENHPKAIEMAKQCNIPHVKILDVLQGTRDIIADSNCLIEMSNRGMLLQLFTTISCIARNLFRYPKIAVNVMGDKSVGKTFPAAMVGMLLDLDYHMVENSENITLPGFQGGINNKKLINGVAQTIFELGIITKYGLTVLDEAERMFSDRQLNLAIKNFPNKSLNIEKVGGKDDIPQNYTPIFCSNFYDSYHNEQYIKELKDIYFTFARKDLTNTFHRSNKIDIYKYIDRCNVFLSLDRTQDLYKNENLTKSIYLTRMRMESRNLDWRTGGRIESSYRILFDVVCQIKKNIMIKDEERIVNFGITTMPEQYIFPVEEYLDELKENILQNHIFNLYDIDANDESVLGRLSYLKESIKEFVLNERVHIHRHLAGNDKEIDPKLYAILEAVLITIQLTENIASIKLDSNVKDFAECIIMKCKRGLTEEEYNFTDHSFRGDQLKFDYDELDLNFKRNKEELDQAKLKEELRLKGEDPKESKEPTKEEPNETQITNLLTEDNEITVITKTIDCPNNK